MAINNKTNTELINLRITAMQWWKTLDMNDDFLCQLCSRMYGSLEQRAMQLYIIKDNLNLTTKKSRLNQ